MLSAAVPNLFGTRDRFRGRQFFHRRAGVCVGMVQAVMQAMGSDGERQMKLLLLALPPLTSCCAARSLTGGGPVPVRGL